ncbi:MAG: hypothetical protein Q8M35_02145, partial [Pseudohongiella sp.]|nr:hypothetical protein [Pseudohongiella sp.]
MQLKHLSVLRGASRQSFVRNSLMWLVAGMVGAVVIVSSTPVTAQSDQPQLPAQMAWTAYNLGTTGYNQSVAIGAMLREKYNVTLRVIPGQNDVSRLLPLKTGRVQFSANGVATYF